MAFRNLGAECMFLTRAEPVAHNRIYRFGFEAHSLTTAELWANDDFMTTVELATDRDFKTIVVDSYNVCPEYLGWLREAGFLVCALDDLASYPFPNQIVVNGGAQARQLHYETSSGDTDFYLGPEFALLRSEFWQTPPYEVRPQVDKILVTSGGSDANNLMPRILGKLDELCQNVVITAILGPFFDKLSKIERVALQAKNRMELIRSPDSIRGLMLEADLAISAGGQTLYELA